MLKVGVLPVVVAQWLNDHSIPTPSESVGNIHTRNSKKSKKKWTRAMVLRIARDKTYLGYVINGKSKKISYKSKKVIQVPKEEYIEVEGMHEALTDQETFDIVQMQIDSRKKTRIYKHDFVLKGLLECEECGTKLSVLTQKRKNGSLVQYLRCNTYASMTRLKLCTPHSNNCEKLTNRVIETIKSRLNEYLKEDQLFQLAQKVKDSNTYKKNLMQNQISTIVGKIELVNKKIDQLYEDKLNGIIKVEDFERMYISTLERKKELERCIEELEPQKNETFNEVDLKKIVSNFVKAKKITREMIVSLVDKITVSENKEIKIYYRFSILNENSNECNKSINVSDCSNF